MTRYVKIEDRWINPDQVTILFENREDDGTVVTRILLSDNNMVSFTGTEEEAIRHLQR